MSSSRRWTIGLVLLFAPLSPANAADKKLEPLPKGAVRRLGVERFRTTRIPNFATILRDGRSFVIHVRNEDNIGSKLQLWDLASGKMVREISPGASIALSRLWRSPDGSSFVTFPLTLWRLETKNGKPVNLIANRSKLTAAHPVAFFPDGKKLLVQTSGSLEVLDVATWKSEKKLRAPRSTLVRCAISPDAAILAIAPAPKGKLLRRGIVLRDLKTDKDIQEVSDGRTTFRHLVFSPDGKAWAAAGDPRAYVFDVKTGKKLLNFDSTIRRISKIVFTSNGNVVVASDSDGYVQLWDLEKQRPLETIRADTSPTVDITMSPDRKLLVTVHKSGRIHGWDANTLKRHDVFSNFRADVIATASRPDGDAIVSATTGGYAEVWDVEHSKSLKQFRIAEGMIRLARFSDDAKFLAVIDDKNRPAVWDVAAAKKLWSLKALKPPSDAITCVAPDNKTIVFADGFVVELRAADNGKVQQRLNVSEKAGRITDVAVSPDGKTVAISGLGKTLEIWDRVTGRRQFGQWGGRSQISAHVCFSPDGNVLARVSSNGYVSLWDVATGQCVFDFVTALKDVRSACFLERGRLLALTGSTSEVQVWDWLRRKRVADFSGHHAAVECLTPLKGNDLLISGSRDGTMLAWDTSRVLDDAKRRKLNDEWRDIAWKELKSEHVTKAYLAMRDLIGDPDASVAFLNKKLKPISKPLEEKERLRYLRAIQVLDHVGDPNAIDVLRRLAKGGKTSPVTQSANSSVTRNNRRQEALLKALLKP